VDGFAEALPAELLPHPAMTIATRTLLTTHMAWVGLLIRALMSRLSFELHC
jgi:hypothetical protein